MQQNQSNHLRNKKIEFLVRTLKDMYFYSIEIIKGPTDKGQFQYLTKLKGPQMGLTCIQHNFFH